MVEYEGDTSRGRDDGFPERLMEKARKIESLSVRLRADELNDHIDAMCADPSDHSDRPVMKSGNQYIEPGTPEWKELASQFEWIPLLFEPFAKLPDPAEFEQPSQAMDRVIAKLGKPVEVDGVVRLADSAIGGVHAVDNRLSGWEGDAKQAWITFSKDWSTMVANQVAIAGLVKFAADSHAQIYRKARKDAEDIADAATNALLAIGPGGGEDISALISVIDAVATAAAAFTPIPKTVTLTLQGLKLVDAVTGKKKPEKLGAHDVHGVLDKMSDAIAKLSNGVFEEELLLSKVLYKSLDEIDTATSRGDMAPRGLSDLTRLRGRDIKNEMTPV